MGRGVFRHSVYNEAERQTEGGVGMEERDIIERLLGRDESGLHDLLRYYGPLMRYIITPIVTDPHHREDCLSEAVMRVWGRLKLSS